MAITLTSSRTFVMGSLRAVIMKLSVGVTGDTQNVPAINHIQSANVSPNSGITGLSATDRSGTTPSYLTFTGTGNSLFVEVLGN